MKQIFTTLALLTAFAYGTSAQQRTTDVLAVWVSPDTGVLNTLPCNDSFDVEFLFINVGPGTVTTADTLFFINPLTPEGRVNYRPTTAPIAAGDTIVHYGFKAKLSQIQRLADPNDNYADVFTPFANGNYAMYAAIASFYNAATPPAGYLAIDTSGEPGAAATAVKIDCGGTGIDDLFAGSQKQTLVTYPNPAKDKLSFKYNFQNAAASVRITDIAGRVVLRKDFDKQSGARELSLDVSALNNGMYYLELVTDKQRSISKVTIAK